MDTTVNPAEDFYRYATGGWLDSHPIPEDESYYDVTIELQRKVDQQIIDILDELVSRQAKHGSSKEWLTKFYKSGIDTTKAYADGLKPIQFMFDSIDNIKSIPDLQKCFSLLQKHCINSPLDFECGTNPHNSNHHMLKIYDYGYCLDKDIYINNDLQYIVDAYKKHIEAMLEIYGIDSVNAAQAAQTIYDIECKIAEYGIGFIGGYDPSVYYETTFDELSKITPNIDWQKFPSQIGFPMTGKVLLCCSIEYISNLNKQMEIIPIDNWKLYLKYMIIHDVAYYASLSFKKEHHKFFNEILYGDQDYTPVKNTVLENMSFIDGELIGTLYTEKHYSESTTNAIATISKKIKDSFKERVKSLDWMKGDTKKMALKKLDSMIIKIGHAEKRHDIIGPYINDSYIDNIINSYASLATNMLNNVNKTVDRASWVSTPQSVNACYIKDLNIMEIDAAILQSPFYYPNGDDAVNYGAIGAIIAHEMTHGFDNTGRKFGIEGSVSNWWTNEDSIEYKNRAQTLVDRFNSLIVIDTMHADGEYTLDENIADLGGLEIAYTAFTKTDQWKDQTKLIDGLTPDQRFFIAYAQSWAGLYRDEAIINLTLSDEHSLNKYRVEGPLPSVDAFIKAFNIKPGDRYYLPDSLRTHIW